MFTSRGFGNWRKALKAFNQHVGLLNSTTTKLDDIVRISKIKNKEHQMEVDCRSRLTAVIDVV